MNLQKCLILFSRIIIKKKNCSVFFVSAIQFSCNFLLNSLLYARPAGEENQTELTVLEEGIDILQDIVEEETTEFTSCVSSLKEQVKLVMYMVYTQTLNLICNMKGISILP